MVFFDAGGATHLRLFASCRPSLPPFFEGGAYTSEQYPEEDTDDDTDAKREGFKGEWHGVLIRKKDAPASWATGDLSAGARGLLLARREGGSAGGAGSLADGGDREAASVTAQGIILIE